MPHQTRDHISCNSRLERTRFGLISGTFSGATVAMAVGRRIIEKLTTEGYFGIEGRELELERLTRQHLERLAHKHPGAISQIDGVGATLAFRLGDGLLDHTRSFIRRRFDQGLALSYRGHQTACVRLFLPAGCLQEDELRTHSRLWTDASE
jgi:4-aminobutyrate aminotransferase-like enzyme